MRTWWTKVEKRNLISDGWVYKIMPGMWTTENAQEFATNQTTQQCKRGDVRVTLLSLLHGLKGPFTAVRRTFLSWYIGVHDDHKTLDMLEAGTAGTALDRGLEFAEHLHEV